MFLLRHYHQRPMQTLAVLLCRTSCNHLIAPSLPSTEGHHLHSHPPPAFRTPPPLPAAPHTAECALIARSFLICCMWATRHAQNKSDAVSHSTSTSRTAFWDRPPPPLSTSPATKALTGGRKSPLTIFLHGLDTSVPSRPDNGPPSADTGPSVLDSDVL